MTEMHITRAAGDRRRLALDDRAWWRRMSWRTYDAEASVDGRDLRFLRTGILRHVATAEDAVTGEVLARWQSRGGRVTDGAAELRLRRASMWKGSWALGDESREVARYEPRGVSGGRMRVLVCDDASISRLMLLFAAWVVSCNVQDDGAAAATAASAAAVAATS
jgi:hypothetical protein